MYSARIVNCTAEGIGIALLAWILLRALGRQNSGTRFAVWFSALIGIAALPLVGHFGSKGAEMAQRSEITMPGSWAIYIFSGWLLMAAAGLVRIVLGFWRLRQLRRACVPIEAAALDPRLRKTLEEFDSPRPVTVCVSDHLRVPTAVGFMKPLVVLPSWTMEELSAPELNTILLHELAHLRRWDDWTNLIQKSFGCAVVLPSRQCGGLRRSWRSNARWRAMTWCWHKTTSPRAYAECLVSLAEKSFLRRGLALAQAAVGRLRHVSLRVAQILDERRPHATRVWRPAPVLLTAMSLACLMVLSDVPRLVSFENASPGSLARSAPTNLPHADFEGGSDIGHGIRTSSRRNFKSSAEGPTRMVCSLWSRKDSDQRSFKPNGALSHPCQLDTATNEASCARPQQHGGGCRQAANSDLHYANQGYPNQFHGNRAG